MLRNKKLLLVFASCLIAASCSNVDERMSSALSEGNVSFSASMQTLSRATETDFESGDKIAVYAVQEDEAGVTVLKPTGNYADNVTYTYSGERFVNEKGIKKPTEFGVRYFAIYPNTAGEDVPTSKFYVHTDQDKAGQYTLSDFCTAVSDVTEEKEVDLVFNHRLSHVVVNLKGELLGTGHPVVRLNRVNTGCDVDLNANTFMAFESRDTVYCAADGTNSYKAIIVPQTIEKGAPFLSIELNGKEYVLKATTDILFASGKQRVFNVLVSDNEIVSYTSNIQPWDKGDRYIEVAPTILSVGTAESLTFSILSHNGATLYELATEGDAGWATFDEVMGIVPEYNPADDSTVKTNTLHVKRDGLVPGEYSFTLIIRSDLGDTRVPVTMTVENKGGVDAEIISCHDDLVFTLTSCTISGTTATLEMNVKNEGTSDVSLQLFGGGNSYTYDDQGNKYHGSNLQVAFSGTNYTELISSTTIPAGVTSKLSFKVYNVEDNSAIFSNISINTNKDAMLVLKNIHIEGRTVSSLPPVKTTGSVTTCDEELEFELLDCKAGSNYTTLNFRVKNNGFSSKNLQLFGGGNSYSYDDQGNKYHGSNLQVAFSGTDYTKLISSTTIPAGIMTCGEIRFANVDSNATEFSNITIITNQESSLIFKNVKIRK